MDLARDLQSSDIILLIIPKERYKSEIVPLAKSLEEVSKRICYVCINEPYGFVSSNLKKNGSALEKFFFIDTLSMRVQEPPAVENCIFVSAPNALTEISLALSKALNEQKCDMVVFDALSTLLIYENAHSLIQFIHTILTKLRMASGRAVFIALKEDVNSELVKDLYMFVDKITEVT
jgi:hypothetical protein